MKPLVAAFDDVDPAVRRSVATALGRIGTTDSVEPLIAGLEDEDEIVQLGGAELSESVRLFNA